MNNLEVKHTPAVAAVDAKPDTWECQGVVVERRVVGGEIGVVCDNGLGGCCVLDPGDVASLHAILSAILAPKDAAKPALPKRVIVTEIAPGDSGGLVVGEMYDVLSWDGMGRPRVRTPSVSMWFLSDRPGEWDSIHSTFSKWVPVDEAVKS